MKNLILFSTIILVSLTLEAAPIPGTSSSKMMADKLGVFKSKFGYEIAAVDTDWLQTKPPKKSKYIETVYRSPFMRNNTRASLSVRVDRMKKPANLRKYVKRWIKEYPKYGYDVLGSKRFKRKNKTGYVIDLINPKKKRQLRQVIYLKDKVAVLMTCRDHLNSFKSSLKECNKIVKSFNWEKSASIKK